MHNRKNALNKWLEKIVDDSSFTLKKLTGDASFRQYHRLHYQGYSRIIMDAPPNKEPISTFITVNAFLRKNGLRAPEVFAVDEAQGFAILEDFGDNLLLGQLSTETADTFYQSAITTLIKLQHCPLSSPNTFPPFDNAFILKELHLFTEWFLLGYLKINLTNAEKTLIQTSFNWISDEVSKQPQCLIHRDYHSRNIMILGNTVEAPLGLIDFQDAMIGPLTYDLVSLLKDCYIQWPKEQVMQWVYFFYEHSRLAQSMSLALFIRAFDISGLQRHLKVLGVFSRLYLRDNKPGYLNDLPLTLNYVLDCLETYEELQPFYHFMQQRIQLP